MLGRPGILLSASLFPWLAASPVGADAIISDHVGVAQFASIPASVIADVQASYRFFYGHTSHGSQIMTGLDMIFAENPVYAEPAFQEYSDDLGHNGDTTWVAPTRSHLDSHPECNVVMWSWCGGASDNTETGIDIYLAALSSLETEYPGVLFVYMTGHLDGSGPDGNLYARNNQIRAYCAANDKVLFDFADIESWDPDGIYYADESDACAWCTTWCAAHSCPSCGSCAHSHCFNCYLKGKGFWWMMATVAGWSATTVDRDPEPAPSAALELAQNVPNPFVPGTRIGFRLPTTANVKLEIFEATGRNVVTLVDGILGAGLHSVPWDGRDSAGNPAAAGTYFYRVHASDRSETRKMTLLR